MPKLFYLIAHLAIEEEAPSMFDRNLQKHTSQGYLRHKNFPVVLDGQEVKRQKNRLAQANLIQQFAMIVLLPYAQQQYVLVQAYKRSGHFWQQMLQLYPDYPNQLRVRPNTYKVQDPHW